VTERLYQTINPLPAPGNPRGWPFGQPLRASDVFRTVLREPGVRYVEDIRLLVQDVPTGQVHSLASDLHQPDTWYAGSGEVLYRSSNNGESWERVAGFPGETIEVVRPHPSRPGPVAAAGRIDTEERSRLHFTSDCGERWEARTPSLDAVRDMGWIERGNEPVLLLCNDKGLFELGMRPDSTPVEVLVDPERQGLPLYAIATTVDFRGQVSVAVAAQDEGGVFLSSDGGRPGSFRSIGLDGRDIRVLAVQVDGPRLFLWACETVTEVNAKGRGCHRWELRGSEDPPDGWQGAGDGWDGGSVLSLAFQGTAVLAASHHAGVLRLPAFGGAWVAPNVNCGLPLQAVGRFSPVEAVGVGPDGRTIMAATPEGVYRSQDGGERYVQSSQTEFHDEVKLPGSWLFCSGEHTVTVEQE
jgi:hypothetical protein